METPKLIETVTLPVRKVGEAALWLFQMHELASHGSHFVHESVETPEE